LDDAISAIRRFLVAIEGLGIDYYIGGSIASIVYGKARTTRDVDFILSLRPESAKELVAKLGDQFHVDLFAVERSISDGDCFNALDLETIFQVDVFTPKRSPWIDEQFRRRVFRDLGAGEASVGAFLCSAEDVVLNKLGWFRLGNEVSKLQWEDAVGVLEVQGVRLDFKYLDFWAKQLGLNHLLVRAREAAEM